MGKGAAVYGGTERQHDARSTLRLAIYKNEADYSCPILSLQDAYALHGTASGQAQRAQSRCCGLELGQLLSSPRSIRESEGCYV